MVGSLGIATIISSINMVFISDNYLLPFLSGGLLVLTANSTRAIISNLLKKTALEISKRNLQDKYFIDDEEINFALEKSKGKTR